MSDRFYRGRCLGRATARLMALRGATVVVSDVDEIAGGAAVEEIGNAGRAPDHQPIHDADMAVFDKVMAVNLRGVMLCMKHELRQMLLQRSGGSIVNIGSVSSVQPQSQSAAYVTAKHGRLGLTKAGSLDTPMLRKALAAIGHDEAEFARAFSLFGRFGSADEVAQASAWLCSDTPSFITGVSLAVDGGYLAR